MHASSCAASASPAQQSTSSSESPRLSLVGACIVALLAAAVALLAQSETFRDFAGSLLPDRTMTVEDPHVHLEDVLGEGPLSWVKGSGACAHTAAVSVCASMTRMTWYEIGSCEYFVVVRLQVGPNDGFDSGT